MRFRVYGMPVPKGSMRAFVVKGRPILTSSMKGLGEWSQKIAAAALQQSKHPSEAMTAFSVDMTFFLPKPKSAKRDVVFPTKRPDIDKLCRGVLDSLTGIIWKDDSQVTTLVARKRFADRAEMTPGVVITIEAE